MGALDDITGKTFGQLTVIERAPNKNGRAWWYANCSCGVRAKVAGKALRAGSTQSCGCRARVLLSARNHKHGNAARGRRSPTYEVWNSMWKRCSNPKHKDYKSYGGRGILVCEEWMRFENFLADMGERPPGLTLDRENVNGNYEKDNCRWVTWDIQVNNKRKKWRGEDDVPTV